MTLTLMKKEFTKFKSRIVNYGSCKNSSNEALNQHVPQKKKYVRCNQMPFMTEQLSKEVMKR